MRHAPPDGSEPLGADRTQLVWAFGLGLVAFVIASVLSHRVFAAMPHVQDSIAQLFQARIFADGMLRAPAPALPQFFQYHHVILDGGHWYSQYPPGHPAALMLGLLIGAPWIIDPLMGGLFVAAVVLLGSELFGGGQGRLVGRIAGILALVSPFFLLMSAEFMSHPTALAAATWGLYGYVRLLRTGALASAILGGLGLAVALLARPFSAFGVALPIVLHAVWTMFTGMRRGAGTGLGAAREAKHDTAKVSWTAWGAFLGTGALGVLLLFAYNAATNGSPTLFGYEVLYGPSHGIGFGKGSWGQPPHTFARGLSQLGAQVGALNGRLFEWPVTSLWPLVLGLLPGTFFARRLWLLSFPVSLLGVHVFYWYSDLCFGPRYAYEALGPILLLSAWGLVRVGTLVGGRFGVAGRPSAASVGKPNGKHAGKHDDTPAGREATKPTGAHLLRLIVPVLLIVIPTAIGLATRWPLLFEPPAPLRGAPAGSPLRAASYFQYFGPSFWGVGPALHEIVERDAELPALVFTRFAEPKVDHPTLRYLQYGCGFAFQEPNLADAPVIYANDFGAENQRLADLYPDRAVYLYDGNVESGTLRRIR
ncbi:MAG: hypothetical protein R3E97_13140 [Candidatus Eisenbacteria bacterium]